MLKSCPRGRASWVRPKPFLGGLGVVVSTNVECGALSDLNGCGFRKHESLRNPTAVGCKPLLVDPFTMSEPQPCFSRTCSQRNGTIVRNTRVALWPD